MLQANLRANVLQSIASWIALGGLPSDGSLPPLKQIAGILDVSVVTVREAVIGLQTLGIVRIRHGKGVYVESPKRAVEDMYETRLDLECLMVRRAAQSITTEAVSTMHDYVRVMQTAAERPDTQTYFAHDAPFHAICYEASERPVIAAVVALLRSGVFSPGSYINDELARDPGYLVESNKGHWAIYYAMVEHDPVAAEVAVRAHLDRVHRIWNRNLDSMRAKAKSELAQFA